jgi:mono/diheme cytochrome c family protein
MERMRIRIAVLIVMGAWGIAAGHAVVRGQQKSVWDGVFSTEQADRGAAAYKESCSECHGGDLMGDGFAPALTGADFKSNWNDLSVGDLFERIRISMPSADPSSVTPAAKADIVAHILKFNEYPAGTTELEPKTELLKQIKIEPKK